MYIYDRWTKFCWNIIETNALIYIWQSNEFLCSLSFVKTFSIHLLFTIRLWRRHLFELYLIIAFKNMRNFLIHFFIELCNVAGFSFLKFYLIWRLTFAIFQADEVVSTSIMRRDFQYLAWDILVICFLCLYTENFMTYFSRTTISIM